MTVRFVCMCVLGHSAIEHCENCIGEPQPTLAGQYNCPKSYRYPECPGCGMQYTYQKPQKSVGNASVEGTLCKWCNKKLDDEGKR